MNQKRIINELAKVYKLFDDEMDIRYTGLYPTSNNKMSEVLSTLHHNFVTCFESMNQRLPTGDSEEYYWADPSRSLLNNIEISENLYRVVKNTEFAFEIDEYYKLLINKCKIFLRRYRGSQIPPNMEKIDIYYEIPIFIIKGKNKYIKDTTDYLMKTFSSEYISQQISSMVDMQTENPTEAIGKSKELIESCCKTILEQQGKNYDKKWSVSQLVKETMKVLQISTDNINNEATTIKAILGNLQGIASNIAELRNADGSGHGKSASYKGLKERHAKLAIGSSTTLVNYLWDIHTLRITNTKKSE